MSRSLVAARLWVRLLRGGGTAALTLLVAMTLGVGLAVSAMLAVAAVPRVLSQQGDVVRARAPIAASDPSATGLGWSESSQLSGDLVITRVDVWNVRPDAPVPPGVQRWPAPGEALVSPAYHQLPASVRQEFGLTVTGTIGSAGLTSPDEILVYVVLPPSADAGPGKVVGFGDAKAIVNSHGSSGLVLVELVLLMLLPAVLFLIACLRLVTTNRERAQRATYLIGMDQRLWRVVHGIETSVLVFTGTLLGLTLYSALQSTVGRLGLLGVTWFPDAGRLSVSTGVLTLILAGVCVWASTRAVAPATRRANARSGRADRAALGLSWAAALLLVGILVYLLVTPWRRSSDDLLLIVTVCAAALVLAAPLAASSLTRTVSRAVAARAAHPGPRLGAGIAAGQARHLGLVLALLAVITMGTAASAGLLTGMKVDALGDPVHSTVQISLDEVSPAQRAAVADISAPHVVDVIIASDPNVPVVALTIATCADIKAVMPRQGADGALCVDEPQSSAPGDVAPITVPLANGQTATTPPFPAGPPGQRWDVKLPPSQAPWIWEAEGVFVTYVASRLDNSYDKLIAALRAAAPTAQLQVGVQDPDLWGVYTQQVALLRGCLVVGNTLAVAGILLTLADLRRRQRRPLVSLVAIGTPRRVLRNATATTFALPLIAGGIAFGTLGLLTAIDFVMTGWGPQITRIALGSLVGWAILPGLGATVAAAVIGFALRPPRFDRSAIQDY